ncbi:MAG: hypothetical protein ACKERG_03755 [Candidatus Hodgkinia cicadicola]
MGGGEKERRRRWKRGGSRRWVKIEMKWRDEGCGKMAWQERGKSWNPLDVQFCKLAAVGHYCAAASTFTFHSWPPTEARLLLWVSYEAAAKVA